eukprot:tig00020539_g10424.t1
MSAVGVNPRDPPRPASSPVSPPTPTVLYARVPPGGTRKAGPARLQHRFLRPGAPLTLPLRTASRGVRNLFLHPRSCSRVRLARRLGPGACAGCRSRSACARRALAAGAAGRALRGGRWRRALEHTQPAPPFAPTSALPARERASPTLPEAARRS